MVDLNFRILDELRPHDYEEQNKPNSTLRVIILIKNQKIDQHFLLVTNKVGSINIYNVI